MKSKKANNRSFGVLFFIVFLIIGFYPMYKGENPNIFFLVLSLPFIILGLLNSKILTPFNSGWIKLGEILGLIIAPLIMAMVYFIFLTPISLIVRIFGKDLLNINFNKKLETYWIDKKKLGSMKKQF